ncbi:MAG TPA: tol-pal system-associated acyl-CoA thioesterase [Usitatibacteraceae bacterium]|nr:tol-pal system-associated acyl-CoA thioesterase [Usitatibacteraceae bacterium]
MARLSLKHAEQSPLFTFDYPLRVYYEDTDAGGVVYHAQYVKYLERARTEWLRHLGYSNSDLARRHQLVFIVNELHLEFLKPARLDDALNITVGIEHLGRVRIGFVQEVRRADEILARARVGVASVSVDAFKPVELPAELKRKMEATC